MNRFGRILSKTMVQKWGKKCLSFSEAQGPLSAFSFAERQLAFQPANLVTCNEVCGFVICCFWLGAVEN